MLMNRRQFLSMSGAAALIAVCSPNALAVPSSPDPKSTASDILKAMRNLAQQKSRLLGYPINMTTPPDEFFAWRNELAAAGINRFPFNNVGNPYEHSDIPFNCHSFEKELINRFGEVYGFSLSNIWGFLSNSGTDSNMHGLYMGSTILKSDTGIVPKIYFTKEAHYSIQILRDLLHLEWVVVGTNADGSMDADDLERQLNANPNYPALVVATIGTTFKGAIDPVDEIQKKLRGRPAYLHLDAALFGGYLPYTSFSDEILHESVVSPNRITQKRYDSISVSCHKFFGFPSPAGLFITTRINFESFRNQFSQIHNPEYIKQVPGTITCSRDAVKPAEFYFFSTPSAFKRHTIDAAAMLNNTAYLLKEMNNHYSYLHPVRANDRSNTIYFITPGKAIVDHYSLATMQLEIDGKLTPCAHAVVMPHVTKKMLDQFLSDLRNRIT